MSEDTPFYYWDRRRAVRAAIRESEEFENDGKEYEIVIAYLEDMARNLAKARGDEEDEAFHFILRCMGDIAWKYDQDIYEPYGYINPFEQEDLEPAPAPAPPPPPPAVPKWKWPVINQPPRTGSGGFAGAQLREYSALKMFGYTVGKTDGWPQRHRQAFLRDFMTMPLPPIVKATFGNEYGAPMTITRLRKVANVIATNATNFYRNDPTRFAVAIANWEEDLDFLYREFYIGKRLAFDPWPSTRPA
jgi:hypothetical protein